MNKEDILRKAREGNKNHDEREEYITTKAFSYGAIGMAVAFIILFLIRLFYKGGTSYDLLAMYGSFLFAHYIYKYRMTKNKIDLFTLICWAIVAVTNLILYIWR